MHNPLRLTDADVRSLGEGEPLIRDDLFPRLSVLACSAQLSHLDAERRFQTAGVGANGTKDARVRSDRTAFVERQPDELGTMWALFEDVRLELNEVVWLGVAGFTVQLAVFDAEGAHYSPHRDALAGDPSRRATAILYLNPHWQPADGGCLRVHPPSGTRDVQPLGGRMVVFRSECLLHEVLPSFGLRQAATAWYS